MFTNREEYLTEAANLALDDIIMPIVDKWNDRNADNIERPNFRISVGFPKHSRGGRAIAVCFRREASTDGVNEIFINPEIDSPEDVMGSMIHELIHACDDCESGHQHFFAFAARKVGLEGKLTETVPGEALASTLHSYQRLLGEFPHAKMVIDKSHKKSSTRQLKVSCTACDFLFRTSQKHIDNLTTESHCPCCASTGTLTVG